MKGRPVLTGRVTSYKQGPSLVQLMLRKAVGSCRKRRTDSCGLGCCQQQQQLEVLCLPTSDDLPPTPGWLG